MVKYSDELTAAIAKRRKEKAKPPVAPPRLRRGLKKKKEEAKAKPKVPKKLVKPNVMKRIQKKVAKLGKDKVKEKKKVGKAIDKVAKKMGKEKAKAKAKGPPKKKPKFKVVKKEQPKKLVKPEVMARIQEKVAKLGKDKVREKKTVGEKIEKKIKPQGQKLTGLTRAQMNAMSPEKLFGLLPSQLSSGVLLNPKRTGVKVGQDPFPAFEAKYKRLQKARDEGFDKFVAASKTAEEKLKERKLKKAQMIAEIESLPKEKRREFYYGTGYDIPAKSKNKDTFIEYLGSYQAFLEVPEYSAAKKVWSEFDFGGEKKKAVREQEDRDFENRKRDGTARKPSKKEIEAYVLTKALHKSIPNLPGRKRNEREIRETELYIKQNPNFDVPTNEHGIFYNKDGSVF